MQSVKWIRPYFVVLIKSYVVYMYNVYTLAIYKTCRYCLCMFEIAHACFCFTISCCYACCTISSLFHENYLLLILYFMLHGVFQIKNRIFVLVDHVLSNMKRRIKPHSSLDLWIWLYYLWLNIKFIKWEHKQ